MFINIYRLADMQNYLTERQHYLEELKSDYKYTLEVKQRQEKFLEKYDEEQAEYRNKKAKLNAEIRGLKKELKEHVYSKRELNHVIRDQHSRII